MCRKVRDRRKEGKELTTLNTVTGTRAFIIFSVLRYILKMFKVLKKC